MLRKATRQQAKIRLGLSAVSGGGKTMSALLIAFGLCGDWDKIAVIDTENNSADLYAHLGSYNVLPLAPPFSPERYIKAISDCEAAGMSVIIIDSIAHEWEGEGGVLALCDSIGGGFSNAWKIMTPRHDKFKQAILQSKCHVITTVRRKQEYALQEGTNSQGRTVQKPVKLGLKEITRDGWEYELTLNLELDVKHMATSSKDRTGLFMDTDPFIPSIDTGKKILAWCESGAEPLPTEKPVIDPIVDTREELTVTHEKWSLVVDAIKNKGYKIASVETKYILSNDVRAMLEAITPAAPGEVTTQEKIHASNAGYVAPVNGTPAGPAKKKPF